MTGLVAFIRSGWSFFFRFPNTHTDAFSPTSIYIGPILQSIVYLSFSEFYSVFCKFFALENQAKYHLFAGLLGLSLLTGFFHEDGLADTADGLGVPSFNKAPERLEKIRAAMKDSRLGSYGVSALALLWLFRFEFLKSSLHDMAVVAFMIFCSRTAGIVSAGLILPEHAAAKGRFTKDHLNEKPSVSGLPSHTLSVVSKKKRIAISMVAGILTCLLSLLLGFKYIEIAKIFFCFSVNFTYLLALRARNGAICGDSIGSSICVIEILLFFLFL